MTARAFVISLALACGVGALSAPVDARAKPSAKAHGEKPAAKKGLDPERLRREVDARIAKRREALERAITRKKLAAAKAGALRTEFNQSVAEVHRKLAAALADGKLTPDEARAVRAASQRVGRKA